MPSDDTTTFSREELMGGLPARRASALLFAVESRTGYLTLRAQQAAAPNLTETAVQRREQAFLQGIAQGREAVVQPTVQDPERYAPEWATLMPADPGLRAAVELESDSAREEFAFKPAGSSRLGRVKQPPQLVHVIFARASRPETNGHVVG